MSRIFEALQKAKPGRPAPEASAVTALVPPAPARVPVPALRAAEARILEPLALAPVPEEFGLELTHLRYALESALAGRACRVVAFSSAQGHEGTTTVASNFARVLSQDPAQRVLVVDAHTRRPGLSALLGVHPEGSLRDVLNGKTDLARHLFAVERRNLRAVCVRADRESQAPFPLGELREFLAGVGGAYDWVILDLAPVLGSADAAAVAALADGVVLVMRAGHVKRPVLARAAEVLRKAGAQVLGSVLNRRRLEIPEFIYRRV
jgi:Mrp family chromosome partitioning ATPase